MRVKDLEGISNHAAADSGKVDVLTEGKAPSPSSLLNSGISNQVLPAIFPSTVPYRL